ncbi:condensation domain-containing protein [Ktedonobacter robiniae]|uniref:Condensation domain-containing protein n=1 Tax=Ktedonobacter robiniae TaxID=2778365 RepID=A0ABQ3V545_9CHLR|nr:condensation domain-containing protein [Ktedonobacter robiniae]GHO60128.1 hypothetical protein KSB_86030 [Ktedonobacter robiniae]
MQAVELKGSRLSSQQLRLWSLQKESTVSRAFCTVRVDGRFDRNILFDELQRVIMRHEILHTLFYQLPTMDVPIQVVASPSTWSYHVLSLEDVEASAQWNEIDRLVASWREEPLDLKEGPLLHVRLVALSASTHVLYVCLPTLCADASTLRIFIGEVCGSLRFDEADADEPLQYADVSAWQDEMLLEEEAAGLRAYWQAIDVRAVATIPVPLTPQRDGHTWQLSPQFTPASEQVALTDEQIASLRACAEQYGVSLESMLLACWNTLLWRVQDDASFLIGVACDGRIYDDLHLSPGLYTRTVPFPSQIENDLPFDHLLRMVEKALQEAVKQQAYFTWEDVEGANKEEVFFPLSFEYASWPASRMQNDGLVSLHQLHCWTEPFVLKLHIIDCGQRLQLELQYDAQQIQDATAGQLASMLREVIMQVSSQPSRSLAQVSLLTPEQQRAQIEQWRGQRQALPALSVHQLFERHAAAQPTKPALRTATHLLSYEELNRQANQWACYLREQGVGPASWWACAWNAARR